MSWIEALLQFEGIIGAILGAATGVTATMIASYFIRNAGTVKMHPNEFYLSWVSSGPEPSVEMENEWGDALLGFGLTGRILFENTSENSKAIRNLHFIFKTDTKETKSELYDDSREKRADGSYSYDPLTHVNILPKQIVPFNIRMSGNRSLLNFKRNNTEVFLAYEIADKRFRNKKKIKVKVI